MAKVWSQMAESKSTSANFDVKSVIIFSRAILYTLTTPMGSSDNGKVTFESPLETFAGQDLLKVLAENLEKGSAQRKLPHAKIAATQAVHDAVGPAGATEQSKSLTGGSATKASPADDNSNTKEAAEAEQKADEESDAEGDSETTNDAEDDTHESKQGKDESEKDERGPIHEGIIYDGCKVDSSLYLFDKYC